MQRVETLENNIKAEFTVKSDTWNTLWLVQKAINEGEKAKAPVKIVIRSGSVESTIQIISQLATIGSFMFAMATYFRLKRKQEKPLNIVEITRDAAYAYALHHLETSARISRYKLVHERLNREGDYVFEFENGLGKRHTYTVTKNLEIEYGRQM
jgi:hypothetical protein